MFYPLRRPWRLAAAGLSLLAAPLAAAPTPPPVTTAPPAPAAPPIPAPPVSDAPPPAADAKTVLDAAAAAHRALTGLSATVHTETHGTGRDQDQTVALAFGRGLGAKAAVSDKTGPLAQIVSDGKTITVYDVHAKQYQARPLPAGATPQAAVWRTSRSLLALVMSEPDALAQFLGAGLKTTLSTDTVGGASVDVVTVGLPPANGQTVSMALSVGHDDHLLRRLTETIHGAAPAKVVTLTETVTALSASPTLAASDFAFTPPVGVKAAAAAPAEPPMHDPRLVPGARPFAIAAKDLNGRPLSLAQYKGKVVLMDFWATWCPPCVGEMPNVIAAYKKYHAQGFDVLGISLDQERAPLLKFIAQNKMPWRQVFDGKYWNSAVPVKYGVRSIPFGLLIGRDGKITAVEVRGPALGPAIEQALAAKAAVR